jgi:predicted DNA-binding transcriptional regulator AlpA
MICMNTIERPLPEFPRHKIVGAAEAAAFCNFSVNHFRLLCRSGRVPKPFLLGARKLGWRAGDLLDWLDAKASGKAA